MSTTTLKLSDELKSRITPLAEAAGKTPNAWMVEVLEAQVALADRRRSRFFRSATSAKPASVSERGSDKFQVSVISASAAPARSCRARSLTSVPSVPRTTHSTLARSAVASPLQPAQPLGVAGV